MLSLDKGPNAVELARMYEGDSVDHHGRMEGTPIYYLPQKNKKYRLELDDAEVQHLLYKIYEVHRRQ